MSGYLKTGYLKTGYLKTGITRHATVVQHDIGQFEQPLARGVARGDGGGMLPRGQCDGHRPCSAGQQGKFHRIGIAPGIGDDDHHVARADPVARQNSGGATRLALQQGRAFGAAVQHQVFVEQSLGGGDASGAVEHFKGNQM